MAITEFMHPRLQEMCEMMPAGIGRFILKCEWLKGLLQPLFSKGRHVETSSLHWFAMLNLFAAMRRWRPSTLRYREEQARIEGWLNTVSAAAVTDFDAAIELAACPRLIKGYGDTFERGLRNFNTVLNAWRTAQCRPGMAATIASLYEAALADERGDALKANLQQLNLAA